VNVICRDTDVLVLLVAHMPNLCQHVWMQAGTTKKKRYIPVHKLPLGEKARASLLAFHALTGCDTTSQFAGIGKKSAWNEYVKYPQLLEQFGEDQFPDEVVLSNAEAFVCKLYYSSTESRLIQDVRSAAFHKVNKNVDTLPPTRDALHLHIRRAHYQTLVWKMALEPNPSLPSTEQSGWYLTTNGTLTPRLLTVEPRLETSSALTSCGCPLQGMRCTTRKCKCNAKTLACTRGCSCVEYCRNPKTLALNRPS
jgi:hypothetical protein